MLRDSAPPLGVWIAAGGIFFTVITIFITMEDPAERCFIDLNTDRLLHQASQESDFKVVVLGTSRTRNGIWFDDSLEHRALLANHFELRDIEFLRIVRPAGRLEHFLPLFAPILDAQPNLVLIESSLLLIQAQDRNIEKGKSVLARFILQRDRAHLESIRRSNSLEGEMRFLAKKWPVDHDSAALQEFKQLRAKTPLCPVEPDSEVSDFLEAARKKGIWIALVEVPRTKRAEALLPTADRGAVEKRLRVLEDKYSVRHLDCTLDLTIDDYRDFAHFNEVGREKFGTWFLSVLASIKSEQLTTQ